MPAQRRLSDDIATVPGIGAKSRVAFARLGIATIGDLLKHLPLRYERRHAETSIDEAGRILRGAGEDRGGDVIAVRGEIAAVRIHPGRRPRIEATLEDGSGRVRLVWFNAPWIRDRIHPGTRGLAQGKASRFAGYLQLTNPTWTQLESADEDPGPLEDRLRPIYPASEELPSGRIERAIAAILDDALPLVLDVLPEALRTQHGLPPLADAYALLHRPSSEAEIALGRRRLAYDELLLLQLGVMMRRWQLRREKRSPALPPSEEIDRRIRARLPFDLTPDQSMVCAEIARDLAQTVPMNRLLQGDVGSGKTAVAAYGCLLAAAHRMQSALLAPTELLAEQHAASLRELLRDSAVRIELLTGATTGRSRQAILEGLASGAVDVAIGTHALLSEGVRFKSLAFAVVDEQHRFGVAQRSKLRERAEAADVVPHMLVMTATPIPRTLALTIFGDLDVSTIRHLPPGRTPVGTTLHAASDADLVYRRLAKRVRAGERAYVVVPAIGGDEGVLDEGPTTVEERLAALTAGPFAGLRLAPLHGRLSSEDREATMDRFRRGDLDALVATTVIEVGVDVPEATTIVIENAERFGLAQLHQLRGRVGRGVRPGECHLIASPSTDEARRRLEAIVSTTDGFRIAELDLEIRGPGELVGARQAGLPPFRVADLVRDVDLLKLARHDAVETVAKDPRLTTEAHAGLRRKLLHVYGEALGLADVG